MISKRNFTIMANLHSRYFIEWSSTKSGQLHNEDDEDVQVPSCQNENKFRIIDISFI
jgi:hypothetical protein